MPEVKQDTLCCTVGFQCGTTLGTSPRGEAECPEGPQQGHGCKSWGVGLALEG